MTPVDQKKIELLKVLKELAAIKLDESMSKFVSQSIKKVVKSLL